MVCWGFLMGRRKCELVNGVKVWYLCSICRDPACSGTSEHVRPLSRGNS
jgi:hypothetical protein